MLLLRLIVVGLVAYLVMKLLDKLFRPRRPEGARVERGGKSTTPLDLTGEDVEDAKFEDIDE